jgi:hypothetical protein
MPGMGRTLVFHPVVDVGVDKNPDPRFPMVINFIRGGLPEVLTSAGMVCLLRQPFAELSHGYCRKGLTCKRIRSPFK